MTDLPTVAKNTVLVIRTDGSEQVIPRRLSTKELAHTIQANTLDFVSIGKLLPPSDSNSDLMMAVDDAGYQTELVQTSSNPHTYELKPVKALKPINEKATALYHAICHPGTTHQIAGDVAVFHDNDFEDEMA